MKWKKLGVIYNPQGNFSWAQSHAMVPTPILLNECILRVFVTFCDAHGVGRTGYVDLDPKNPLKVLKVSENPILDIGKPGTFDENGVLACSVVSVAKDIFYLYYVGFELGTKIRYRLLSGLAISRDGGETFNRVKTTPILERSPSELYFRGGPMVLREGGIFRMWYVAGSEWINLNGKEMPMYSMKYLESEDGIKWADEGKLALKLSHADEHGFGRPWVVHEEGNRYKLFYSIRRKSLGAYRLGYAESANGVEWLRKDDEMGLDVTSGQFDQTAIMYSAVISICEKTYCFYNGDDFGKAGFAVAELIKE